MHKLTQNTFWRNLCDFKMYNFRYIHESLSLLSINKAAFKHLVTTFILIRNAWGHPKIKMQKTKLHYCSILLRMRINLAKFCVQGLFFYKES